MSDQRRYPGELVKWWRKNEGVEIEMSIKSDAYSKLTGKVAGVVVSTSDLVYGLLVRVSGTFVDANDLYVVSCNTVDEVNLANVHPTIYKRKSTLC